MKYRQVVDDGNGIFFFRESIYKSRLCSYSMKYLVSNQVMFLFFLGFVYNELYKSSDFLFFPI